MSATVDRPSLTLEVGFTTSGGSPVWTSVPNIRRYAIRRGRVDELGAVQAGTLDITVGNPTGALSPDNAASPYYPNITPVVAIRLTATYNSVAYVRYRGFVQSWTPVDNTVVDGDVQIAAVDFFNLAALGMIIGSFPAQDEATRIGAVLDRLDTRGLPRALDYGPETLLPVTLTNVSALQHIQDVIAQDRGLFFCAADGTLTYHNRYRRYTAARSHVSQATFGQSMAAGALNYTSMAYTYDDRYIYNEIIVVTTNADATQIASDTTSQGRYGRRSLTLQAPGVGVGQAFPLASFLLLSYKDAHARVGAITIDSDAGPAALLPHQLGREIGDRITIVRGNPGTLGINRDMWIEGVAETFDAAGSAGVVTTWNLSDPAAFGAPQFVLDTSLLDGTDTLVY